MLSVAPHIQIAWSEIDFSFARSSGPGGQNVNKVNSKCVLRWDVIASASLPPDVRARFLSRYASRMTTRGELVLSSDEYRDQGRNQAACIDKLCAMLREVAYPPKVRGKTKPTYGSRVRRQESKRKQGAKKQARGRVRSDD